MAYRGFSKIYVSKKTLEKVPLPFFYHDEVALICYINKTVCKSIMYFYI